jgi:chemotaxis protein methyltransferase CheR
MKYPAYEAIADLLVMRSGLTFPPARQDSAERGIRRAMERVGSRDPSQYRDRITRDADAFDDLIVELTVGETYFFREPAQFEFIRRQILPEVQQRLGAEHEIRAWSAACASGEEAYSLAVVLAEGGLSGRVHLVATDISRPVLVKARRAEYTAWSLRGDGAKSMQPYLRRQGDRLTLNDTIRRQVQFEYLNLALDVYPSFATGIWGMDLILCRNVLIYFDRETIHQVAQRLHESLAFGGWLITASSDPPLGADAPFETVVTEVGVFYRRQRTPSSAVMAARQGGEVVSKIENPPSRRSFIIYPQPSKVDVQGPDSLVEARNALVGGDYGRAAALTRGLPENREASLIHVQALSNHDISGAERACGEATARHPLSPELHYLHAVLLLNLGRIEEAAQAARRVIYLDRSLAMAHFTLGSILRRRGDKAGARRAYRNARQLCAAMPADQVVLLGEGEQAGRLAEAAATELAGLGSGNGGLEIAS